MSLELNTKAHWKDCDGNDYDDEFIKKEIEEKNTTNNSEISNGENILQESIEPSVFGMQNQNQKSKKPRLGRARSFRRCEMCCLDVQNAPVEHFRKRCAVGVCTLSSRQGRVWGGFGNSNLRPWRDDMCTWEIGGFSGS